MAWKRYTNREMVEIIKEVEKHLDELPKIKLKKVKNVANDRRTKSNKRKS